MPPTNELVPPPELPAHREPAAVRLRDLLDAESNRLPTGPLPAPPAPRLVLSGFDPSALSAKPATKRELQAKAGGKLNRKQLERRHRKAARARRTQADMAMAALRRAISAQAHDG